MDHSRFRWWLLAFLLFAFLLRSWNLGEKSLWLDEAFAVWNAERSPAEIWSETHDNHPPTYYLMLHFWLEAGRDEGWVRLPSVFVSILSVALTYTLSRRLFGRRAGWTAAALLAVAPLSVWYAQEARMVIFVVPFALLIALGLVWKGWQGGLLIFAGLAGGLYFDYTIVPLWAVLSGLWLAHWWGNGRDKQRLAAWLTGSLAGWLAFAPLGRHLAAVISRMGNIFVIANVREQLGLPDLGGLLYLLGLLGLGVCAFAAAWLWRRLEERPSIRRLLPPVVLAGFVLLTLFAPVPRLYSVKRLLVTGWPFAVILTAVLLNRLKPRYRWVRTGILTVSFAAACAALWLVPKDDWRGAVEYINQHSAAGDVVWLAPASGQNPYNYYRPEIPPALGLTLMENPPAAEIWHIAERQPGNPIPNGPVEAWLDENRPLLEVIPFYRLEVRHYGGP